MSTEYEWAIEWTDENEEIMDVYHADRVADLSTTPQDGVERCKAILCLIWSIGNDLDGLQDKSYAYPINGKLPNEFENGKSIPSRFQKELAEIPLT